MYQAATHDNLHTEVAAEFVRVRVRIQFSPQHGEMRITDVKNIGPDVVGLLVVPANLVYET